MGFACGGVGRCGSRSVIAIDAVWKSMLRWFYEFCGLSRGGFLICGMIQ